MNVMGEMMMMMMTMARLNSSEGSSVSTANTKNAGTSRTWEQNSSLAVYGHVDAHLRLDRSIVAFAQQARQSPIDLANQTNNRGFVTDHCIADCRVIDGKMSPLSIVIASSLGGN